MKNLFEIKNEEYKEDAKLLGYTFISRTKNLGKYYCNKCNDYFEYYTSGMKSLYKQGLKVNCPCCFKKELLVIQTDMDLSEIQCHSRGTYTFKYNKCGHWQTQKLHSLIKRESKICFECVKEDHKVVADSQGLIFIGKAGRNTWNYQFKDCGHFRVLSCTDVRFGNFRCAECFDSKLRKEAVESNLVLVGKSENKNANYRQYKTICCGSNQDIPIKGVRANSWICHTCKVTAFNKPSIIYLLELSSLTDKWLKLGYSKNVNNRIYRYGLIPEIESSILHTVDISTGEEAIRLEKNLHKKYKQLRVSPEIMRPLFINSGFTECYPLELKDTLLKELHELNIKIKEQHG